MLQTLQPNMTETSGETAGFDFSYVGTAARIAVYDDLLSLPHITEIAPAPTTDFIGTLSAEIYNQAQHIGGSIPFTAIKQVTENFIHAKFQEIVVSILDKGNTIRFADQGPGIRDKERAQQPGFSSATADMKKYIDGVGSGLPIVREYLDVKHGRLLIEDNLNGGAVVTLTLTAQNDRSSSVDSAVEMLNSEETSHESYSESSDKLSRSVTAGLSKRGRTILLLFSQENIWGVQDISETLKYPLSSTHAELKKLEEAGIIEKIGTKRVLSPLGQQILNSIN